VGRDLARTPDRDLLLADDADAFALFYDRYVAEVLRWAERRVGEYAADLTAETFAQAWLVRRRYREHPSGSALPWLFGIARNVLRESLRKRQVEDGARRRLGLPGRVQLDPHLEAVDERLSFPQAVREAVANLSEGDRELLRLRAVDGRPYREIATRLGCTQQAARLRVSRLLRQLRLDLGGDLS
jgi:RNA polymerase sigma factor (sigma-70 family)